MKKKLLVYSGGLDSTSLLFIQQDEIGLAVSFNYGSRHNAREIDMAALNCQLLGIDHKIVDLTGIGQHLKSALLGDSEVPEGHYEDATMKSTVVPFRNAIMLSIATGIAESHDLDTVMLASHKGDNAVYPDCRPEFNTAMKAAMAAGTYEGIKLEAPFELLDKKELCQLGLQAGMNPELTYSCYKGGETHCGVCSTCRERDWALGLRDEA